jgi:hypothetical protein
VTSRQRALGFLEGEVKGCGRQNGNSYHPNSSQNFDGGNSIGADPGMTEILIEYQRLLLDETFIVRLLVDSFISRQYSLDRRAANITLVG